MCLLWNQCANCWWILACYFVTNKFSRLHLPNAAEETPQLILAHILRQIVDDEVCFGIFRLIGHVIFVTVRHVIDFLEIIKTSLLGLYIFANKNLIRQNWILPQTHYALILHENVLLAVDTWPYLHMYRASILGLDLAENVFNYSWQAIEWQTRN